MLNRIWNNAAWLLLASVTVSVAHAQAPAQAPVDRMSQMQSVAQALGVQCNYCHSGQRGSGQLEPKKDIARVMFEMTDELNAKVQQATGKAPSEVTRVTCLTCHRGVAIPRQLNEIMLRTVSEKGSAAAVEQFRDLRQRYYGHQSYDFGEETLLSVGQQLSQGRPEDALALLNLNLEYYPKSTRTYGAIAFAHTRRLNDTAAMAALEKALEIEPENSQIRGRLEQLKSYKRNR